MAYIEIGGVRQVVTASVEAFRERISEIQKELKECQAEREKFLHGIKAARKRAYFSKQKGSALRLKMEDATVKLDRVERNLENAKARLYSANRKTQDNIEVTKSLQTPQPDLDELVQTIHKANQFAALMRSKKAAAAKRIEELEDKIERAERRYQKADDFIYTIQQKMATHRHLMDNPVVSTNYKPMKQDEYAEKVSALKEKIRLAAARTRKAENGAAHLDKRLELMENAIDNYDRRVRDFQQGKREIMGSK